MTESTQLPPILRDKHWHEPSAFTPESLLREARRQKQASTSPVPEVCILDPDGDIVRSKRAEGLTRRHTDWVCYHTELDVISLGDREVGIVGCAVGSAFAVLVAEELFACGCRLLLSLTSAGQLTPVQKPPYFILIDRALRDEGTSYHYCPPSDYSHAPAGLVAAFEQGSGELPAPVIAGASWTTDAPFRETETAIEKHREEGLLAVEMEAAALYAFAEARGCSVLCFAHVTNQMGQEGDFEKGDGNGVNDALELIERAAQRLLPL
ncbi:nucleoside phosphorylase [Halospina sp. K52047b]|uniref:nucleoside phosphorylase n=1 Tax=Halospina sp. K52047b TaxID=2614160 RepID=UPI00124AD361|nr:nucleoside phosphorylase [Halospina sp. K52047b]KAA8982994.1 nucleoside phosphorylase [Halospina sp. K52047b]